MALRSDGPLMTPVSIGLVGAGKGGSALLDLILDWPGAKVSVVIDARGDAPALRKAKALGIPTAARHLDVFASPVNLVLEVTGNPNVLTDLLRAKPPGVEVIGAGGLRFFWDLLADQAAVTEENTRLLEETNRRAREQAALNAIATAVSQWRRLDELLRIALDKVLEVTGREHGWIRLKDPVTGEITLGARRGVSEEHIQALLHRRTPGGKSDQVFTSGKPLIVNDPQRELRKGEARREGFQAIAWIPLKARERVLGILNVATSRPVPFVPREVDLLQAIGNVVGVAVENARLYEEVRGARDFLQSIAENSVDAIVTTDPHGRVTYFSPGAKELFGFRAEDTLGQGAADYYQGGLEEARAIMRRLGTEGRIRNYETAVRTKDGRWVEVSSSVSLLRDARGAVAGTMAVLRDITERKRAEERLRQAELQYRQLVESVPAIVWRADAQTFQFSFVSTQAEAILGYPVDQWVTEPNFWKDHLHPDDRDWAVAFCVSATKESRPHDFEYRMIAADGRVVWLRDLVQVAVENDRAKELIGVMVDITERKRAEEAATALAEMGRELAATLDLHQAADRVVSTVCHLFGVRRATLFLLDPTSGTLTCVATAGEGESKKWLGRTLPVGAGIAGRAVREGRAIWSPDVLTDPGMELPEWMVRAIEEGGPRSEAGVPLTASGEVLGALALGDIAGRVFTEEDIQLLSAFSDQAALAIANARLYHRAEERARKLTVLSAITRIITSARDSREVFQAVAKAATTLLGAKMARVWVSDPAGHILRAQGNVSVDPQFDRLMGDFSVIPYGAGVISSIFEARVPEYILDVQEDRRWLNQGLAKDAGLHAFAGVPLIAGDRVVGVLAMLFGDRRAFTPEEQEVMSHLADHAAIAINRARLFEETERRRCEAESLAAVGRLVTQSLDLEELGGRIVESLQRLVSCPWAILYRREPESGALVAVALPRELEPIVGRRLVLPRGTSASGLAIEERRPVAIADLLSDPRVTLTPELRVTVEQTGYRSILAVPLAVQDRIIGSLAVGDHAGRVFGEDEAQLVEAFAAQAAIALENARLYGELRAALEQVQASQQQLVQTERLRALGGMAGGVAHDFNNLLAVILGRAQYLQMRWRDLGPEVVDRSLEILEQTARDGAETVRRLFEFTRGAPPAALEPVDLNQVVRDAMEASAPRWKDEAEAQGRTIHVETVLEATRPVLSNAPQLREALLNLIFNAVDAMPEGGRLRLATWDAAEEICLSVADEGVGMPDEVRRRIFEPFFTTKGPQQSGLGLAMVYGIISRHGGSIGVESREGEGTEFFIQLPVATLPVARSVTAPAPQVPPATVLVIDDEESIRQTLADILEVVGHTVVMAPSGSEGLAWVERQPFDLVCTDLGMPGMSGWQVAQAVKTLRPNTPVALITGWSIQVSRDELEAHQVDFLLSKPFEISEVMEVLAQARDRAALNRR